MFNRWEVSITLNSHQWEKYHLCGLGKIHKIFISFNLNRNKFLRFLSGYKYCSCIHLLMSVYTSYLLKIASSIKFSNWKSVTSNLDGKMFLGNCELPCKLALKIISFLLDWTDLRPHHVEPPALKLNNEEPGYCLGIPGGVSLVVRLVQWIMTRRIREPSFNSYWIRCVNLRAYRLRTSNSSPQLRVNY